MLLTDQLFFRFYDSFGGDGMEYLQHVFRYIQDEHLDKKKSPLPDIDEWKLVPCTNDTPRQGNGTLRRVLTAVMNCFCFEAHFWGILLHDVSRI